MMTTIFRAVAITTTAATLWVASGTPVSAAAIRDDGEFFSGKAIDKAESELAALKRATGKQVRIETFNKPPATNGEDVSKMDKTERAKFFERIASERGTLEHTRGIYVLISKHPGHVQVEVDRQTRKEGFGNSERNEMRDKFLQSFEKKDYDRGLLDAVAYAARTLEREHPREHRGALPVGIGGNHPAPPQPHQQGLRLGWLGWIIVAVLVLVGIRLISALFSVFSGANRPGYGGGYGPGPGGPGGPGGYGGYGGGGGGMLGGLMSGMFGAFAGNWLYNSFFGNTAHAAQPTGFGGDEGSRVDRDEGAGEDFQGSGGDFGSDDTGSGGGDFGSGDSGGGDFGGDSGGGDFGGGGGDFGGGGDSGGGDF